VSVDLARELAQLPELPLELVVFDAAGKSVAAVAGAVFRQCATLVPRTHSRWRQ
jgi:hypothetical protein